MRKLGRSLIIGAGAILALAIVFLLAVNLYVQSQATQARIQQELSQRLGTSLHIRRISVTPWAGLKLSGITIPQTKPGAAGNFLDAKTFRLRVQFVSLFSKRLIIKEVSLIKANVVWIQNADGKWRLPEPPSEAAPPLSVEQTSSPAAMRTASPRFPLAHAAASSPPVKSPASETENREPARFVPEIRRVNLADGAFHFFDENGKVVARFTDVDFRSSLRSATALRGMVKIGKTSLRDRFFLEQLQSPLQYDPAVLDFSNISAEAAGGQINGRFSMRPQEEDSPFTARIRFHDLQADQIVSQAGGPQGTVRGRLEGALDAAGKTADPNALNGRGEIYLREGEVQQYSLLVALGQILQIEELTQLHLQQAEVKYHINPGVVTVDQLVLRSPNIWLSATGTITFAGKLRLESKLAVNEKIRGQLFRAIRDNFQPTNEPGYAAVAFQVSGTVDRPKTNLMDKLVGQDLKDLGSVLNSLFGGGKSEHGKKKKRPTDESAGVAPSPAAPSIAPLASPSLPPVVPPPETTASPTATP